jgi:hypothetical protein
VGVGGDIRAMGAQSCVTTEPDRSYVMDQYSAPRSEGPRICKHNSAFGTLEVDNRTRCVRVNMLNIHGRNCEKLRGLHDTGSGTVHKCYYLVQPTNTREKLNIELFCKFGKVKVTVPSPPPHPAYYARAFLVQGGGGHETGISGTLPQ